MADVWEITLPTNKRHFWSKNVTHSRKFGLTSFVQKTQWIWWSFSPRYMIEIETVVDIKSWLHVLTWLKKRWESKSPLYIVRAPVLSGGRSWRQTSQQHSRRLPLAASQSRVLLQLHNPRKLTVSGMGSVHWLCTVPRLCKSTVRSSPHLVSSPSLHPRLLGAPCVCSEAFVPIVLL